MSSKGIRVSPVAGAFYPDSADKILQLLKELEDRLVFNHPPVSKVALVPHAGLAYSGVMALRTLKWVRDIENSNPLFILLGPSHYGYFNYVALDNSIAWNTPLGEVKIDYSLIADSLRGSSFRVDSKPYSREHSLDMLLIVLQYLLGARPFRIMPLLISDLLIENLNSLLIFIRSILEITGVYLLVSTDLSHYPVYRDANLVDMESINTIIIKDPNSWMDLSIKYEGGPIPGVDTIACGKDCVYTILYSLSDLELTPYYVGYYNAGDIDTSIKDKVVGYGGILFGEYTGKDLIKTLARYTLDYAVRTGGGVPNFPYVWQKRINSETPCKTNRTFVTIYVMDKLRGCIGNIRERKSTNLFDSIVQNTIMAAFQDPRFLPMRSEELLYSHIEVSLLETPHKVKSYRDIKIGKHGVIFKFGKAEAVFLPDVPIEQGWNLEQTLRELSIKAGLSPEAYKNKGAEFWVFGACKIKE